MWPKHIRWQDLRSGVEIEFAGGRPADIELLPGWQLPPWERMDDDGGGESGGELLTPPLLWGERAQIREMLRRVRRAGGLATWACGLHVHVGLQPWGQDALLPLVDAALACQDALRGLLLTAEHRLWYCPPVTAAMRLAYAAGGGEAALRPRGRPQSRRCGINAASWYERGTVEIRYANATLRYGEVLRTVELCLRFVAAAARGATLPGEPAALAAALGAPSAGYPPPLPAPLWYRQRLWLEEALMAALAPRVRGEVLSIRPEPGGVVAVVTEDEEGRARAPVRFRWRAGRWEPA